MIEQFVPTSYMFGPTFCHSSPMSTSICLHHDYKESDQYFSKAFQVLSELRTNDIMTDIVLTSSSDSQPCKTDENDSTAEVHKKENKVDNEMLSK